MSKSREQILQKLRTANRPFKSAPTKPAVYQPVTSIEDASPDGMLARFKEELERLKGEIYVVRGDEAARDTVLALLESHNTRRIVAWDFKYIPVDGLQAAITKAGYALDFPKIDVPDDSQRQEALTQLETAEVGLTGADAVAATTGTLIVSTGEGKGRIPSLLPPVHIAVVTLEQLVPRLEDWLTNVRADGGDVLTHSSSITMISGPSRTADIEKQLVLGVHGPKRLQVVVKRPD